MPGKPALEPHSLAAGCSLLSVVGSAGPHEAVGWRWAAAVLIFVCYRCLELQNSEGQSRRGAARHRISSLLAALPVVACRYIGVKLCRDLRRFDAGSPAKCPVARREVLSMEERRPELDSTIAEYYRQAPEED